MDTRSEGVESPSKVGSACIYVGSVNRSHVYLTVKYYSKVLPVNFKSRALSILELQKYTNKKRL